MKLHNELEYNSWASAIETFWYVEYFKNVHVQRQMVKFNGTSMNILIYHNYILKSYKLHSVQIKEN